MKNYSRSRISALVCSLGAAALGVVVCLLWLAPDVAAVTTGQAAAPAPLVSRLRLDVPAVFTYPLTTTLDLCDTFGPRIFTTSVHSRYDFHLGVNWCAAENTPVHAVTTGTVQSFDGDCAPGAASCFVHLTHASIDGQTRYDHLAGVSVTNGITVVPGQVIGWVGSDTSTSSSYLHFEVHDGLTVTQRAAIHPLNSPFLPWTNHVSPTVALRGVYTDATGLTALVQVSSPYTEPDVITVSVAVSGAVADGLAIDYIDLNANALSDDDLDDPLINDVCIIPAELSAAGGYSVTLAFRRLGYGSPATVTAQALDVDGWGTTDTAALVGGLEMTPPERSASGELGQSVALTYTLTNRSGSGDTFTLTHLSAQGWPAIVTPATRTLANGTSVAVTVQITVNANQPGAPDCGLLVAAAQAGPPQIIAGFYRLARVVPPTDVDIDGVMEGNVNTAYTFTAHVSPATATVPITYTWQATGQSDVVTSTSALSHAVSFAWGTPGVHVITVTAANAGGAVADTHNITINVPPGGVSISGPTSGNVHIPYSFTAAVSPPTATLPITYRWQATGQNVVEATTSALSHTVSFTWTTPGAQAITVTVANAGGGASDTHTVAINAPPTGVDIAGPSTGFINAALTFTAAVSPPTATLPITYYWQAAGLSPQTHVVGSVTDPVSFTWDAFGPQTITVTAANAGGSVSSTHDVTITAAAFPFYDGFELGLLNGGWSTFTTSHGRVRVSDTYPHSGTYSVLLDNAVLDENPNTAAIILHIDLAGQSGVVLDFWWRGFGDENHAQDGVFISANDGANWYRILSFNNGPASFRHEAIHLDAAAAAHGLSFNNHFQIKFQFYDDWPIPDDGYAIDDVWVREVPVVGVDIVGSTTGNINTAYAFNAVVSPSTSTLPISYTWSPAPALGQGAATATYTWPITGLKTITVTATNLGGVATDTHVISINVPPGAVVLSGPAMGNIGAPHTFTAAVTPPTTTLPLTYTWQATGQSEITTSTNALSHVVSYTWNTPGVKTIVVTVANVGGSVADVHTITINVPPGGVNIGGPAKGNIHIPYTFTATVSPPTATWPITYTWQATGQGETVALVSASTHAISFTWDAAGAKALTVTVANAGGTVGDTHTVVVNVPPAGVSIAGPSTGVINAALTFTATVSPPTATLPITYTWQATGLSPQTHVVSSIADAVSFDWQALGPQTVTVTAVNAGGAVYAVHHVTVTVASFPFYDGFESGVLDGGWSVFTTKQGRVRVSGTYPHSGTYSVLLDNATLAVTDSVAALILNIDLAGQSGVVLDFWWRRIMDTKPEEGVYISDDGGDNWCQALSFDNGPQAFRHEVIYLDAEAAACGLTFNDHFQIKFHYYDNVPIPGAGYAIDDVWVRPEPVASVDINGPATGNVHTPYAFAAVVSPPTATLPISYTWSPAPAAGQGAAIATYTWPITGRQTISVTATNVVASASDTHAITISVPPAGVSIGGPAQGNVHVPYTFTAAVNPPTTTLPITYAWQATGQSDVVASVAALSHAASFTWAAPGVKAITVTASNVGGGVVDTHVITIYVPPSGVHISGQTQGVIQVDYAFTAAVSPVTTTQPITYVWQATEQGALTRPGGGPSDTVSFNWAITGAKTITVTASNAGGAVVDTHVITLGISPLSSLTLNAPITSVAYVPTSFSAVVGPVTATRPITYIWRMTNQPSPVIHGDGGLSDAITRTWTMTGAQIITVTAINVGNTLTETRVITILSATSPESVAITGPTEGVVQFGHTFTATVSPITTTAVMTYIWQATDGLSETHASSRLQDTVSFAWETPGPKTVAVTAMNPVGAVSQTHVVTTYISPLTGVNIAGPVEGLTQSGYSFTATVSPPTATAPITYHWQATGQSDVVTSTRTRAHAVLYVWDTPGLKTITVTAAGVSGAAISTHLITVSVPLTGASVSGPAAGNVNVSYAFSASVTPPTAATPITYHWQATGQSDVVASMDALEHTVVFAWSAPGPKAITLTATNVGGSVTATHAITIHVPPSGVSIGGPTLGNADTFYTFTASVSPPTATTPIVYAWSPQPAAGQGSAIATYTWPVTGLHTIYVTATNAGGEASDAHVIFIGVPVAGVGIVGPTAGNIHTSYVFTASVSPPTATTPIAYAWSPEPAAGQGSATATYNWSTPGWRTIVVTATNAGGEASDSHIIVIRTPVEGVNISGPTVGNIHTLYTFSAAVSPSTATLPIVYTWSPEPAAGQGSAQASYTWPITGAYTVVVTATNAGGSASDAHAITIVAPVESVDIFGPTAGNIHVSYTFTAVVSPPTATTPIAYVWSPEPAAGQGSTTATYNWSTAGLHTIVVTATNAGGEASDSHAVAIRAPVEGVDIGGPVTGNIHTPYTFTAAVNPSTATLPIVYVWSPEPAAGQGSATVTYTWPITGLYTVAITATNAGGSASDSHAITIVAPVREVSISGPATGNANVPYVFTATVAPPTTTLPIAYTWWPQPAAGQGSAVVTYTWPVIGHHTIAVTATNAGGSASDAHLITIGVPVDDVDIGGPATGKVNTPYTFTAAVIPSTATWPITYTWSPQPAAGQGSAVVQYVWSATGAHTISVAAANAGGEAIGVHVVTVELQAIYLPLLVRNWPPVPDAPTWGAISPPGGNTSYTIRWNAADWAETYILQEATSSAFSDAATIYSGAARSHVVASRCMERYYYRVMACNGWGCSNWSAATWVDVRWECEPNDPSADADGPLATGVDYYGRPNDDNDYFFFQPSAQGQITLNLTNHTGGGVQLLLYYQSVHAPPAEARCIVGSSHQCQIVYPGGNPPDRYYVRIYTESGYNDTPYTLRVTYP